MAGEGLVSMTPTSVSYVGTSASINADGGVEVNAVTSISIDGVFTSSYTNYMMVVNLTSSGQVNIGNQFRVGGVTASASNYITQNLAANATSVSGGRNAAAIAEGEIGQSYNVEKAGFTSYIWRPFTTERTCWRTVSAADLSSAFIRDVGGTHNVASSYDGILLKETGGGVNFTGLIHIFGFEE